MIEHVGDIFNSVIILRQGESHLFKFLFFKFLNI